ncbi:MAG: 50S ribosomal protein L1 [Pseudomonadota bacterium]|nr:50S ribosomal protein L1 [Pseudomonadota bacterium]
MAKLSKSRKAIDAKYDFTKQYPIIEALDIVRECSKRKFKESVDISIVLGIDARKESVRGATVLPHGTGKEVRVAVFAEGADAEKALAAGADRVGLEDLAESIKKGDLNYNVVIASPATMRVVGQLGTILGPRGLMPNPKVGTVTTDIETAVRNAKSGQVRYRADKAGIIHCPIGKADFTSDNLKTNLEELITSLVKLKPSTAKGVYVKKVYVSTTMGPGVAVDLTSLKY